MNGSPHRAATWPASAPGAFLGLALFSLCCPCRAFADGQGLFAKSCVQGYARAFAEVNNAAAELRLKLDNAQQEVDRAFQARPPRCEAGSYDYYLDQLMQFVRRALRSGATPQSPKDGWTRAAAYMMSFSPRLVPQAEYYADMQRFQATKKELISQVVEAGAGPLVSALVPAFERAAPAPGAYGPPTAPAAVAVSAAPEPPAPIAVPQPVAQPVPSTIPAYINFPRTPMPDWAVIHLHEIRDLLKVGRTVSAQAKLDQVIRWVEQP